MWQLLRVCSDCRWLLPTALTLPHATWWDCSVTSGQAASVDRTQSPSCDCGQATDHEPHCRHVPIYKIWRWTESTPRSGWWCSHMAGIYSDCSTREVNKLGISVFQCVSMFVLRGLWTLYRLQQLRLSWRWLKSWQQVVGRLSHLQRPSLSSRAMTNHDHCSPLYRWDCCLILRDFIAWLSAFSALTLLVWWQEGHLACKNCVVGCWHGYLSGARCRLAYGPADATDTHYLLLQ